MKKKKKKQKKRNKKIKPNSIRSQYNMKVTNASSLRLARTFLVDLVRSFVDVGIPLRIEDVKHLSEFR